MMMLRNNELWNREEITPLSVWNISSEGQDTRSLHQPNVRPEVARSQFALPLSLSCIDLGNSYLTLNQQVVDTADRTITGVD